jgi:hypothetical protein
MAEEISIKSTKNEIMDAYNTMLKKVKQQEKEKPAQSREAEERKETVTKAKEETEENIVNRLSSLKLETASTFDKLEKAFLQEQRRLSQMQQAIDTETKHLEDLYNIKAETDTLAALILTQKEKRQQFESDIAKKKEDFDNEIFEIRTSWDKERKTNELTKKEEQERLQKERKREEDDYRYNLQQTRKKEQDSYNANKETLDKELSERKILFEKEIAEREKNLSAAEQELETLRKESEGFATKLNEAIQYAEERLTTSLQRENDFEKKLLLKENEGLMQLKEQTIGTLQQRIKELEDMLKQQQSKAEAADKNVKDIAIKAIESSGKVTVYEKAAGAANINQ